MPIPTLIGAAERPHEFQNLFQHSFNILRSGQEYAVQQGPGQGLTLTMTRLNSFESQMDLGADFPASGVLPVKVEITTTPRALMGLILVKCTSNPWEVMIELLPLLRPPQDKEKLCKARSQFNPVNQ